MASDGDMAMKPCRSRRHNQQFKFMEAGDWAGRILAPRHTILAQKQHEWNGWERNVYGQPFDDHLTPFSKWIVGGKVTVTARWEDLGNIQKDGKTFTHVW